MNTFTCSRCRSTTDDAQGYDYKTGTATYRVCPPCAQVWAVKFPGLANFALVRLAMAAVLLAASLASAGASACLEKRDADEDQIVRLTDSEGKKHRYKAFIMESHTDTEVEAFHRSRLTVGLDDSLELLVKVAADSSVSLGAIGPCKEKAKKYPKL